MSTVPAEPYPFTFDLVLVASIVAFLSGMSLARALTRGKR